MSQTARAQITVIAALILAIVLMLTILAGRAHAEEDNFPDWIFSCPAYGDVMIWGSGYSIVLTIRGARPPFYLAWIKDEPELTVESGKCELIYPVEQS
jgi:hypothetical protein